MLCIPVFRTEPRFNAELQGLPVFFILNNAILGD